MNEETGDVVDEEVFVLIKSSNLKDALKPHMSAAELYEEEPRINAYQLVVLLNQFKEAYMIIFFLF